MNTILFFKSQIAGYTRLDGTYVKPHSDKRTTRAVVQAGQRSLFEADATPPNRFKGADPVASTPDLFNDVDLEGQFKQHGDGFELRHEDGRKWAVLMPDASHDDAYRYQVFGASGLKEHHTFANADDALQGAITAGFTKPDIGAMDRLAPAWEAKFADEAVQAAATTHGDRSADTVTDKAAITRARRKAVLDILGDGWKAQAGVDGAHDAYKKVLRTPAGKRMEVIIQPEKTVDGNFYVGSHVVGKGGSSGSAKTIEEAKAMAEKFEGAAMGTKSSTQTRPTDTPAFKKWFGDSKVVGTDGKPLVVYHGTKADFDTFHTVLARTSGALIRQAIFCRLLRVTVARMGST